MSKEKLFVEQRPEGELCGAATRIRTCECCGSHPGGRDCART